MRCRDDADKDVVKQCLEHSLKRTVEVRAEDADILIMLTHRYHRTNTNSSQLLLQMVITA